MDPDSDMELKRPRLSCLEALLVNARICRFFSVDLLLSSSSLAEISELHASFFMSGWLFALLLL